MASLFSGIDSAVQLCVWKRGALYRLMRLVKWKSSHFLISPTGANSYVECMWATMEHRPATVHSAWSSSRPGSESSHRTLSLQNPVEPGHSFEKTASFDCAPLFPSWCGETAHHPGWLVHTVVKFQVHSNGLADTAITCLAPWASLASSLVIFVGFGWLRLASVDSIGLT